MQQQKGNTFNVKKGGNKVSNIFFLQVKKEFVHAKTDSKLQKGL